MERYDKIYIKTEADLPKEEGNYYVHEINRPEWDLDNYSYASDHSSTWLNNIDWYFQLVEQPSDEAIKWNNGDIDAAYFMGVINSACHKVDNNETYPSIAILGKEIKRLKKSGFNNPHDAIKILRKKPCVTVK